MISLILICLCAGFWIGKNPQYYQDYLDLNKPQILFYSPDLKELLPPAFQKAVVAKAPVRIRFIETDPEAADILLVDQTYLKTTQTIDIDTALESRRQWRALFTLVSPDFQTVLSKEKRSIPVLWKVEGQNLRILSLVMDADKGKHSLQLWSFIEIFLSDELHTSWLKQQNWNTTLLKFDEGNTIPENRKASYIRKLNLSQLHY